jgi:hypothetical protein
MGCGACFSTVTVDTVAPVWLKGDDLDVSGVLGLLRVVSPGGGLSNRLNFNVVAAP